MKYAAPGLRNATYFHGGGLDPAPGSHEEPLLRQNSLDRFLRRISIWSRSWAQPLGAKSCCHFTQSFREY